MLEPVYQITRSSIVRVHCNDIGKLDCCICWRCLELGTTITVSCGYQIMRCVGTAYARLVAGKLHCCIFSSKGFFNAQRHGLWTTLQYITGICEKNVYINIPSVPLLAMVVWRLYSKPCDECFIWTQHVYALLVIIEKFFCFQKKNFIRL